jgi:hypothetical protein
MPVQVYGQDMNTNHLAQRMERKFYLPPQKVGLAYGSLMHLCKFDGEYPSEQINSLYFDTAGLEQHEKSSSGDFQKDKVRIRWYGEDCNLKGMQNAFLELKSRRGFASTKQRLKLQVPAENLSLPGLGKGIIAGTLLVEAMARFGYFPRERLEPVIKISYWRYRFLEAMTGQRVSLDYHIRSTMIMAGYGNGAKNLELPGGVIEVKGTGMELPLTLQKMKLLDVDWSRYSKYSSCIDSHDEKPGTAGYLSPSGKIVDL